MGASSVQPSCGGEHRITAPDNNRVTSGNGVERQVSVLAGGSPYCQRMPARLHGLALPVLAALSLAGCGGQSTTTAPSPSARSATTTSSSAAPKSDPTVVAPALRHRHDRRRAARAHHRAAGRGRPGPLSAARRAPPGGDGHVRGRGRPGERRPGCRRTPRDQGPRASQRRLLRRGVSAEPGRLQLLAGPLGAGQVDAVVFRAHPPEDAPRRRPRVHPHLQPHPAVLRLKPRLRRHRHHRRRRARRAADLQCRLVGPAHRRPERR